MQRVITSFGKIVDRERKLPDSVSNSKLLTNVKFLPLKTKMLAWWIFLIFFIEAGTMGLLPRSFYFVYRNVRLSDILLYMLTVYSLFCVKEYQDLYKSKSFLIIKYLLLYMLFQYIISTIAYKFDFIEYFFRLKQLWMSFLVFPFLLLLKREGLGYLAKIILPFAVISNIFYILSATSGVTLMPDTDIVQQDLPGGLKVYRVFGGTFFGEVFMLGIIFYWNEYRFKLLYVPFVILFGLPHLLAFGRGAWISFALTIFFIIIWSSIRKHNLKTFIRQVVTIMVTVSVFAYVYNQFVPRSEELTEAIEARIQQGQDDYRYGEGTYGTRMANIQALLNLWLTNPIFGIGMHPMWVIKPVTTEENIYSWGFSDVRWASVLAAYGAIGFLFAILFQLFYVIFSFRLLRKIRTIDISYFFLLIFLTGMLRDTIISYSFILTTVNLFALGNMVAFYVANFVYLYEKNSHLFVKQN